MDRILESNLQNSSWCGHVPLEVPLRLFNLFSCKVEGLTNGFQMLIALLQPFVPGVLILGAIVT